MMTISDYASVFLNLVLPLSLGILIFGIIVTPIFIIVARSYFKSKRDGVNMKQVTKVGFFHPYCNTGGGGERVLWCAIRVLQTRYPHLRIVVYTGDLDSSPDEIVNRVHQRFSIVLPEPVEFIYLRRRQWVEPNWYPYFTLLGQSLGSIILGFEALFAFLPDLYIDTMGYAFTYPLFKYIGCCQTASYTHYPTITSDMLRRVSQRCISHNNRRIVTRSPFLTAGKLLYYRLFSLVYSWAGCCADAIMVNSSWTEEHINEMWRCPLKTQRVYPPCDVDDLKKLHPEGSKDRDEGERPLKIISVGQFRPEKDHPLQLRTMYELRQMVPEEIWDRIHLVIVGSCRNSEDEQRMHDMRDLCKHLSLENNVEFKVNISYEELRHELQMSLIGLHTMWNEHFGIGVVECMAAGLLMIAHRSGGPCMDIIEEAEASQNGFLAEDEMDYARVILKIIQLSPAVQERIRVAARASVERFSVAEFAKGFLRTVEPFLRHNM